MPDGYGRNGRFPCLCLFCDHQLPLRGVFCDHQLSLRGVFCDHQRPLPLHRLHDDSVLRGDGLRVHPTVLEAQLNVCFGSLVQGVYGCTCVLAAALEMYPEPPGHSRQSDPLKPGNSGGLLVDLRDVMRGRGCSRGLCLSRDHQLPLPLHLLHDSSVLRGDGERVRPTVLEAQLIVRFNSHVQGVYGCTYVLAAAVQIYLEPPVQSQQFDPLKSRNSGGGLIDLRDVMRGRGWCRGLSRNHQLSLPLHLTVVGDSSLGLQQPSLGSDPLPLHLLHDGSVLRGDGVRRPTVLGAHRIVRRDSLTQGVYGCNYVLAAVLPMHLEPPSGSHQFDPLKTRNSRGVLVELRGNSRRWRWTRVSIVLLRAILVFRVRLP